MKNSVFILWLFVLLMLFNGCNLDGLDFEKLSSEVSLSPEFVAPIAKTKISVWDMISSVNKENDTVIKQGTDHVIKIVYQQNNLFNYDVAKFLDFPNVQVFPSENKILGEISPADVIVSNNVTLNDLIGLMSPTLDAMRSLDGTSLSLPVILFSGPTAGFSNAPVTDFTSITLSKGNLEVVIDNRLKVPISIQGSLYDKVNNRTIKSFTFNNIAPNGTSKIPTSSLAGVILSNQVEFRLERFETTGSATPVILNLADYFKLTFNMTGLSISSGNLKVKSQTLESSKGAFGFVFSEADMKDMKAYGAVLKSGSVTIKTTNNSPLTGTVNFVLNEIKKNGNPISASISLTGNSTTIPLDNAVINFSSDPNNPYNTVPYTFSLTVNASPGYINYLSTDAIKMDITLNNLKFQSITGDFGKRSIQVDPGIFDMNVDILDKIDGSFKLANPTLKLTIHNSIGMPAKVDLDFIGTNKAGTTASLDPPVFDLPIPANINAGVKTGSIIFDKTNSKIVDFIALPPTGKISYSGKVDFNTSATPITVQNPNFLDLNATFAIDMAMELPLELQIKNLSFKDTTSISGEDFEQLETAELILNAKNDIPLDIDIQLLFVDTIQHKQFGASKNTRILSATKVDASGKMPLQSNTFKLEKADMENLRKSNGIVIVGTLSSPAQGAEVATIKSTSEIDMNVVIKAKANLKN